MDSMPPEEEKICRMLTFQQNVTSGLDNSYTYAKVDDPIKQGRAGSNDSHIEEMRDHGDEAAAGETEANE